MIGWLMMGLGLFALAAIVFGTGGVGAGGRRTSPKAALAAANEENRRLREQITTLQAAVNPIPTYEEIAAADATDPAPRFNQPAPAFVLGAQPRQPDPAPRSEPHLLTELVQQDAEATQSLGVGALRAAAAMDAGETQVMDVADVRNAVTAVVPVPPLRDQLPPVTWGITATRPLWEVPAGPGSTAPTELSPTTGKRAVINVADAVTEAS